MTASQDGAPSLYSTGCVTSCDGTIVGYRQLGQGPGVVLLHGGMSSAHNHMQLGVALSEEFTVFIPDRRGRGQSGAFGEQYCMHKEVEDLKALLAATGARNVFGVSSGALIVLESMLALASIDKAAIFEPPFFEDVSLPETVMARLDREMSQGKVAAALITAMKGAQMGPSVMRAMPRWLLELLISFVLRSEDKQAETAYVPLRTLASTLHYDSQLVVEMSERMERLGRIHGEVLLLGGSRSPGYLKTALDALAQILPKSKRVEFPGLDHAASWNSDRGGNPEPVADALRHFFG